MGSGKMKMNHNLGEELTSIIIIHNTFLPFNISNGDLQSNTREGILLIKKAAVRTACPHKYFGTFIEIIILRATSSTCLFFRSATPFCYGVYGQVVWCCIPWDDKYSLNALLVYSVPLSGLNTFTTAPY